MTATLLQILSWVIAAIVCISLFAAFFYSHYITKTIVSISVLSKKMANMDLNCRCDERRNDEIGVLANSLNELALNLARALDELKSANLVLQRDIDKERELDRQRMILISAVSHELKTPIIALQGQLEGMLQNYGSYKDRDKYLATQEAGSCIILGKDAAKEPDGVAKVSFDLGNTWLTESEALYSEAVEVEYWTFDEYQSYAKTVEQNLTEMLANNESDLSEEDIQSWRQTSAQVLEFIKSGGKVSKNTVSEDSQLMVSALDNSLVGKVSEK